MTYQQRLNIALRLIEKATIARPIAINNEILKTALQASNGLPTVIAGNAPLLAPQEELDIFDSDRPLTPPVLSAPPPVAMPPVLPAEPNKTPDGTVSKKEIEEELQREEKQDREFKNSPFPLY